MPEEKRGVLAGEEKPSTRGLEGEKTDLGVGARKLEAGCVTHTGKVCASQRALLSPKWVNLRSQRER
jgi:hypothetical protein